MLIGMYPSKNVYHITDKHTVIYKSMLSNASGILKFIKMS